MKRSITIVIVLIVVLALVAVGIMRWRKPAEQVKPVEAGLPVTVAPVTVGSMRETVPVTGTLKAERAAQLKAQVSARVTEVRVQEGDQVTQGQVLVLLEQNDIAAQMRQARAARATARAAIGAARAQERAMQQRLRVLQQGARPEERSIAANRVAQAEAVYRKAQADLARRQKLFTQGAISREELEAVQTAFEAARADLDSARNAAQLTEKGARPEELAMAGEEVEAARRQVELAQANAGQASAALERAEELVSYTVIRAPLRGVVYMRRVEPGEIVGPGGDPILGIADLSSVYFEARVPGRLVAQVHAGQPVDIAVRGGDAPRLRGAVQKIVPVANPNSRDFQARISLPKLSALTRPGNYAQGEIIVEQRQEVLLVPKEALVERGGRQMVYVVVDNVARERPVSIGLTDALRAEIRSGLQPGDAVVTAGASSLQDGVKVVVQPGGGR